MAAVLWFAVALLSVAFGNATESKPLGQLSQTIETAVQSAEFVRTPLVACEVPDLVLLLENLNLSGLKSCKAANVGLNQDTSSFNFNLECAELKATGDYDAEGKFTENAKDTNVKSEGTFSLELTDYEFIVTGKYEKATGDQKYIQLNDFKVDGNPKGTVLLRLQNKDGKETHQIIGERAKKVEKAVRQRPIETFFNAIVNDINERLKNVPALSLGL